MCSTETVWIFPQQSGNTVWECIDCQSKKFPSVTLTNHEIQNISFNSNFNCKWQTTVSDPNDPTYPLIYDSVIQAIDENTTMLMWLILTCKR